MLLSKELNRDQVHASGNLGFTESKRMSVDNDSVDIILHALTDLYSDPEKGVLREYLSNAIDTHVESGQTDSILVTRPNFFDPNFIVEDFGTGMSSDTLLNVYSKYGYSTKRQDLNQIGAYGCGAKSALTIADQFTVESVHNGSRTVAIISKDDRGVGVINIISETDTDDRNGTKITIPIQKVSYFNNKIDEFMMTSKPGMFLVDGIEPDSIYSPSSGYIKHENVFFSAKSRMNFNHVSLIIGGISYPFNITTDMSELNNLVYRSGNGNGQFLCRAIIEMPIGSVDFTPSRDEIRNTNHSIRNITEAVRQASEKKDAVLTAYFNSFDKKIDAVLALNTLRQAGVVKKNEERLWKGEKLSLNKTIAPEDDPILCSQNIFRNSNSRYLPRKSSTNDLFFVHYQDGKNHTSIFATIKTGEIPNDRVLKKLFGKDYFIYFIPEDHPLLKDEEFISLGLELPSYSEKYEMFKAENRARRAAEKANGAGSSKKASDLADRSYPVKKNNQVLSDYTRLGDFDPEHEYFMYRGSIDAAIMTFMPESHFFKVPSNHREDKVVEYLSSIGVTAYTSLQTEEKIKKHFESSIGKNSVALMQYFAYNHKHRDTILTLAKVNHDLLSKEISQFVRESKEAYDKYETYSYHQQRSLRTITYAQGGYTADSLGEKFKEIYAAYPMLKYASMSMRGSRYNQKDFIKTVEEYIQLVKENES